MFRIIDDEKETDDIINMCDMKPLQVGVIEDDKSYSNGAIVMRTAITERFEVMDLSEPHEDNCWDRSSNIKVRLLSAGTRITLEVL